MLVDHLLEMVDFEDERKQDERVGEILRVLRDLAHECQVAVVLASHLRRPKEDGVEAKYIRPTMQSFAGSAYVERMARVAGGLWHAKPPPEPRVPKLPQPKVPKKASLQEAEAIHAAWQEAKRAAEAAYNKERSQWIAAAEAASTSIVCTAMKVTEGDSGFDFMMKRIMHAGLVQAA